MDPYYDQDASVWAREKARKLRLLADSISRAVSDRLTAKGLLGSVGLAFVVYGIAFAVQSRSAENFCLRERHAGTFYVSPWTLTRYCTVRGTTFEAGDP